MNNKKIATNLLVLLLFLLAIPVLIVVVQRVAEMRSRAANGGTLILSRTAGTITPSTEFDVQIAVSTGGTSIKSRGVDVVLTFPTNLLELISITPDAINNSTPLKLFAPVSTSTYTFDEATVRATANASGTLSFGAVPVTVISPLPASPTPPYAVGNPDYFAGSIQLATLRFRAKAEGTAAINFVPATIGANGTNDSNIASFDLTGDVATDLLGSVTNLTVNIGGTVTNTPTPTTPAATSTPTPTSPPGATNTPTPTTGATCPRGDLGDIDCDGLNNETDGSLIMLNWRTYVTTPVPEYKPGQKRSADITGDGLIDEADFSKLMLNWKTQ